MGIEIILGIFTILLLLVLFLLRQKKPPNFPPGPRGLPILGNVVHLTRKPYKGAMEMAKKYGDIVGLTVGSKRLVIFNGAEDIREIGSMLEFVGKEIYNPHTDQNSGVTNKGLIYTNGKVWMDQRRFCLKTFREFGVGRRSLESIMMIEVEELIEHFRKTSGTPISTSHVFNAPMFNIIWHVVASQRFAHDEPKLLKMIQLLDGIKESLMGVRAFFFIFPWLVELKNKFPFLFPGGTTKLLVELWTFFDKSIEEHRRTIDIDNPRDFIDSYLKEAQKTEDDSTSSFSNVDKDEGLKLTLLDLFIAGTETSSTTMTWLLYFVTLHPQVQLKVYNELRSVTKSQTVCFDDRSRLPYTEAVICETNRVASLVPLALRTTTKDVAYKGFLIPKSTLVFPNLYAAHHDQRIWTDPENFRPERFLSKDGTTCVKNPNLMIFAPGKRSCAGELLARDEIFLFFANLILKFSLTMPEDEPAHSSEALYCGINFPEPHKIILTERNA